MGVLGAYKAGNEAMFRHWERHGQPKIALKIRDDSEMVRQDRQAGAGAAADWVWCVVSLCVYLMQLLALEGVCLGVFSKASLQWNAFCAFCCQR